MSEIEEEYQTRNGEGSLEFFSNFIDAFRHSKKDKTVWKISWDGLRWRPKLKSSRWSPQSEAKLESMLPEYAAAKLKSADVFWVHQLVMPPIENFLRVKNDPSMTEEEKETTNALACIAEILTETEFVKRYS